jgi:hypothetical protein
VRAGEARTGAIAFRDVNLEPDALARFGAARDAAARNSTRL